MSKKKFVLVLDDRRGIFAGELLEKDLPARSAVLKDGRHCFWYPSVPGHEGTFGLASYGPGKGARIGPPVTGIHLGIARIIDCTEEAAKRWRAAKWDN